MPLWNSVIDLSPAPIAPNKNIRKYLCQLLAEHALKVKERHHTYVVQMSKKRSSSWRKSGINGRKFDHWKFQLGKGSKRISNMKTENHKSYYSIESKISTFFEQIFKGEWKGDCLLKPWCCQWKNLCSLCWNRLIK